MPSVNFDKMDELKRTWTDRLVIARSERPELARFEGRIGRVVTVNYGGKAIVDFGDGAWYDIPALEEYLQPLAPDDPTARNTMRPRTVPNPALKDRVEVLVSRDAKALRSGALRSHLYPNQPVDSQRCSKPPRRG